MSSQDKDDLAFLFDEDNSTQPPAPSNRPTSIQNTPHPFVYSDYKALKARKPLKARIAPLYIKNNSKNDSLFSDDEGDPSNTEDMPKDNPQPIVSSTSSKDKNKADADYEQTLLDPEDLVSKELPFYKAISQGNLSKLRQRKISTIKDYIDNTNPERREELEAKRQFLIQRQEKFYLDNTPRWWIALCTSTAAITYIVYMSNANMNVPGKDFLKNLLFIGDGSWLQGSLVQVGGMGAVFYSVIRFIFREKGEDEANAFVKTLNLNYQSIQRFMKKKFKDDVPEIIFSVLVLSIGCYYFAPDKLDFIVGRISEFAQWLYFKSFYTVSWATVLTAPEELDTAMQHVCGNYNYTMPEQRETDAMILVQAIPSLAHSTDFAEQAMLAMSWNLFNSLSGNVTSLSNISQTGFYTLDEILYGDKDNVTSAFESVKNAPIYINNTGIASRLDTQYEFLTNPANLTKIKDDESDMFTELNKIFTSNAKNDPDQTIPTLKNALVTFANSTNTVKSIRDKLAEADNKSLLDEEGKNILYHLNEEEKSVKKKNNKTDSIELKKLRDIKKLLDSLTRDGIIPYYPERYWTGKLYGEKATNNVVMDDLNDRTPLHKKIGFSDMCSKSSIVTGINWFKIQVWYVWYLVKQFTASLLQVDEMLEILYKRVKEYDLKSTSLGKFLGRFSWMQAPIKYFIWGVIAFVKSTWSYAKDFTSIKKISYYVGGVAAAASGFGLPQVILNWLPPILQPTVEDLELIFIQFTATDFLIRMIVAASGRFWDSAEEDYIKNVKKTNARFIDNAILYKGRGIASNALAGKLKSSVHVPFTV